MYTIRHRSRVPLDWNVPKLVAPFVSILNASSYFGVSGGPMSKSQAVVIIDSIEMEEDHCRVLGDCSRSGLDIVLTDCSLTHECWSNSSALAEVLGRNQGTTHLA
jgi:hypothetical protein